MKRILCVFLALVVATTFAFSPTASAAGMSVSPGGGDYDTEFDVVASGFLPGEAVDTWVNKPYQWRVGQGQYSADEHGRIEFSFRPDVTWGTGGFFASAQGLKSGIEVTADFSISREGYPLEPCLCRTVLLGSPGGTAVNYNAQGYGSSEIVVVYRTDPSGQIVRLPNAQADPWGNLAFPVYLSQDSLYGPYLYTARGIVTGRESYNTLTFWGGIQNHRSSNAISFATPVFVVQAAGLRPGETVYIRLTASNGATHTVATTHAGPDGTLRYDWIVPPGTPFGVYLFTAYGATSHVTSAARYMWDGVVTPQ